MSVLSHFSNSRLSYVEKLEEKRKRVKSEDTNEQLAICDGEVGANACWLYVNTSEDNIETEAIHEKNRPSNRLKADWDYKDIIRDAQVLEKWSCMRNSHC